MSIIFFQHIIKHLSTFY